MIIKRQGAYRYFVGHQVDTNINFDISNKNDSILQWSRVGYGYVANDNE